MKKMKGIKMCEWNREAEERGILIQAEYFGWSQQVIDREIALITSRWESRWAPNDLFADTAIMDRYGMESCFVTDLENAAAAFRAVFAE